MRLRGLSKYSTGSFETLTEEDSQQPGDLQDMRPSFFCYAMFINCDCGRGTVLLTAREKRVLECTPPPLALRKPKFVSDSGTFLIPRALLKSVYRIYL